MKEQTWEWRKGLLELCSIKDTQEEQRTTTRCHYGLQLDHMLSRATEML
jgi:hypothetical protein